MQLRVADLSHYAMMRPSRDWEVVLTPQPGLRLLGQHACTQLCKCAYAGHIPGKAELAHLAVPPIRQGFIQRGADQQAVACGMEIKSYGNQEPCTLISHAKGEGSPAQASSGKKCSLRAGRIKKLL